MENIREFYTRLELLDKKCKGNYKHGESEKIYYDDLIFNIQSKILSFPLRESQLYYSKMITNEMIGGNEEFIMETIYQGKQYKKIDSNTFEKRDDIPKTKENLIDLEGFFQYELVDLFARCDIDIYDDIKDSVTFYTNEKPLIKDFSFKGRSIRNREYTAPRQVLAIQSILSEMGVNVDKTRIVSFMQFLTGRQPDLKAKDTTLYKLIDSSDRKGKTYNEDCDFVAQQFIEIGLINIGDKIKNGKE